MKRRDINYLVYDLETKKILLEANSYNMEAHNMVAGKHDEVACINVTHPHPKNVALLHEIDRVNGTHHSKYKKIYPKEIPDNIQTMLDKVVDFQGMQDALNEYRLLKDMEQKINALPRGLALYVDVNFDAFYNHRETNQEEMELAEKLDEEYSLDQLIALSLSYYDEDMENYDYQ